MYSAGLEVCNFYNFFSSWLDPGITQYYNNVES